ncbi:MAG: GIY-YIG nuclease family protein, partial [Candidatus Paceibacterota bacterium]
MSTIESSLLKQAQKLPETPGVYFFRGPKREILYIGKATSLRDRVKSYLSKNLFVTRGPLLVKMLEDARSITFIETDSVIEALILEAHLIKKHQPEYNTRDKDNKSWSYVIITNEEYPRVLIERGRTLPEKYSEEDIKYQFGPFSSALNVRYALKIIRKLFPFRDTCVPFTELTLRGQEHARPCFNAQIGLCPGVCIQTVTKKEYTRTINHIKLFFEGKKSSLVKALEREMRLYARTQEFEKAERVKKTLFALRHINDIALISRDDDIGEKYAGERPGMRIEAFDISHFSGSEVIGVMTVIEDGRAKKSDYRRFKVRTSRAGDTHALKEVLERRVRHDEWPTADIVVTDGGVAQLRVAESVFVELYGVRPQPSIVSVVKNEQHKPKSVIGKNEDLINQYTAEILFANAEAHRFAVAFQKMRRTKNFIHKKRKN